MEGAIASVPRIGSLFACITDVFLLRLTDAIFAPALTRPEREIWSRFSASVSAPRGIGGFCNKNPQYQPSASAAYPSRKGYRSGATRPRHLVRAPIAAASAIQK